MTPQQQFDKLGYAVVASTHVWKAGDVIMATIMEGKSEQAKVVVRERTTRAEFERVTAGHRPPAGFMYYRVVAE